MIIRPYGDRLFLFKVPYSYGQSFRCFIKNKEKCLVNMFKIYAKYNLGQVLRHKKHPFRGVVFDVDPEFSNSEDWYASIPEKNRPEKQQPFYHLLAENEKSYYIAYVSEQNLEADCSGEPVGHPDIPDLFGPFKDGAYPLQFQLS